MASAVIGALRVNLGIDSAEFSDGLGKAQTRLKDFEAKLANAAKVVAGVGIAVAGAAAVIGVAMVKSSAESAREVTNLAAAAGTGTEEFRKLAYAARTVGVEQDKLADILKDVRDRVGDFLITGAGPMADFFETVAPKIGLTIDAFRGLSGPEALLLFKDSLDKANVSAEEQVFFLEAMASDLTLLQPLLANGGAELRRLAEEAGTAGLALSDIETEQIRQASLAFERVNSLTSAFADQLTARLAPILQGVAEYLGDAAVQAGGFGSAIDTAIDWAIRIVGAFADEWAHLQRNFLMVELTFQKVVNAMNKGWALLVERIMAGVAEIREGWNSLTGVFGVDPIPAYSEGMAAFVEQTRSAAATSAEAIAQTQSELNDLLAKPLPSESIQKWIEEARGASEEAARLVVESREAVTQGVGGGGIGTGEDVGAASDKAAQLQEQMERQLEILRYSLMTEEEAEISSHEKRMAQLTEFLDRRMITLGEFHELEQRAQEDHAQQMLDIAARQAEEEARIRRDVIGRISGMLGAFSSLLEGEGEKNFNITKAISMAVAAAKGIEATISAYAAGNAIGGPPVGIAYAAIAAATTAAQIAQLAAVRPGSRGGGGSSVSSSGSGSSGAAAATPSQTLNLSLRGIDPGQLYSGAQVRDLAAALVEYQRDGGQLVIVNS